MVVILKRAEVIIVNRCFIYGFVQHSRHGLQDACKGRIKKTKPFNYLFR